MRVSVCEKKKRNAGSEIYRICTFFFFPGPFHPIAKLWQGNHRVPPSDSDAVRHVSIFVRRYTEIGLLFSSIPFRHGLDLSDVFFFFTIGFYLYFFIFIALVETHTRITQVGSDPTATVKCIRRRCITYVRASDRKSFYHNAVYNNARRMCVPDTASLLRCVLTRRSGPWAPWNRRFFRGRPCGGDIYAEISGPFSPRPFVIIIMSRSRRRDFYRFPAIPHRSSGRLGLFQDFQCVKHRLIR